MYRQLEVEVEVRDLRVTQPGGDIDGVGRRLRETPRSSLSRGARSAWGPARPAPPWHSDWRRLHLVTRARLAVPVTPRVKHELQRRAELRQLLIRHGMFN